MKKIHVLLLFCIYPMLVIAEDSQNWKSVLAKDPLSNESACLIVSTAKIINDGQSNTLVQLIYNGHILMAKTESNIDLSYPDIGLKVDNHAPHKIERLHKKTNAVFNNHNKKIRDEFIKGLNGKLTLGFWPTWPKTKSFDAEFDLRGFTKSHEAFLLCKNTGKLP